MRMLYISLVWLIVIILIWACFYYISIEETINFFNAELDKMYDATIDDDFSSAKHSVSILSERWKKIEKLWVYFIHQADVDDITTSILKIDAYIKTEDKSLILSEIEELKKYFKMVEGNESLTLENIF